MPSPSVILYDDIPTIFTEREGVILRPLIGGADCEIFFESFDCNRFEIAKFDPHAAHVNLSVQDIIDEEEFIRGSSYTCFGMWDGAQFVGAANIHEEGVDGQKNEARIGYWVDKAQYRRGYATLGARAISFYAALFYDAVNAHVMPDNHASIKIISRAGLLPIADKPNDYGWMEFRRDTSDEQDSLAA